MQCITGPEYVEYLRKHGIKIGSNVIFTHPSTNVIDFTRPSLVEIGNNCHINANFTLLTHDFASFIFRNLYSDFLNSSGAVKIGDNCVFGRNVTVLKGVTIGNNCLIGIGSIVTQSIPDNSVAVGAPARVVCTIEDYYKKRKAESMEEAIDYCIAIKKRTGRDPLIEEMTEEFVLFLNSEEYRNNSRVKKNVDMRLEGYIDVDEFLKREKPYGSFDDFLKQVHLQFNSEERGK